MTKVRLYTPQTVLEMLEVMPYSQLSRRLAREHKTTPKMGRLMIQESQREIWTETDNNKVIDRFTGTSVPKMPDFSVISCLISGQTHLIPTQEAGKWGKIKQLL